MEQTQQQQFIILPNSRFNLQTTPQIIPATVPTVTEYLNVPSYQTTHNITYTQPNPSQHTPSTTTHYFINQNNTITNTQATLTHTTPKNVSYSQVTQSYPTTSQSSPTIAHSSPRPTAPPQPSTSQIPSPASNVHPPASQAKKLRILNLPNNLNNQRRLYDLLRSGSVLNTPNIGFLKVIEPQKLAYLTPQHRYPTGRSAKANKLRGRLP